MQKHERAAFDAVRQVAEPLGCQVAFAMGRGTHKRITITTLDGRSRTKPVSSSPSNLEVEVNHTRQWARRTLRELGCG